MSKVCACYQKYPEIIKEHIEMCIETELDEKYIKLPVGIVDWIVALKCVDALTPIPSGSGPTRRGPLQMGQADLIRPLSLQKEDLGIET